jgi:hypothetical protein
MPAYDLESIPGQYWNITLSDVGPVMMTKFWGNCPRLARKRFGFPVKFRVRELKWEKDFLLSIPRGESASAVSSLKRVIQSGDALVAILGILIY